MQFMLETLKVDAKFISPHNHGLLVAERHIRTVSNFLTSCLGGNGRNWDLYCQCVAYAYNIFTLPTMGNSPFQMVYLRDPPTLEGLVFNPVQAIAKDHREYVELLKDCLQHVSKTVLNLQSFNQQRQACRQRNRISKRSPWCEGLLVFLLAPTAATLQTNSKKIRMDYVGRLVITSMLDPMHAVLSDLCGRQIYRIFHVNRLKVAWVRTETGLTNNIESLRKSSGGKDVGLTNNKVTIVDESEVEISNVSEDRVMFRCQTDEVDLKTYKDHAEGNSNITCDRPLDEADKVKLAKHIACMPKAGEECDLIKAHFKDGNFEVIVARPGLVSLRIWIPLYLHPSSLGLVRQLLDECEKIRIGSPKQFFRSLRL